MKTICGTFRTSEISAKGKKIKDAMEYNDRIIVQLEDDLWYYYGLDLSTKDPKTKVIEAAIEECLKKHHPEKEEAGPVEDKEKEEETGEDNSEDKPEDKPQEG